MPLTSTNRISPSDGPDLVGSGGSNDGGSSVGSSAAHQDATTPANSTAAIIPPMTETRTFNRAGAGLGRASIVVFDGAGAGLGSILGFDEAGALGAGTSPAQSSQSEPLPAPIRRSSSSKFPFKIYWMLPKSGHHCSNFEPTRIRIALISRNPTGKGASSIETSTRRSDDQARTASLCAKWHCAAACDQRTRMHRALSNSRS